MRTPTRLRGVVAAVILAVALGSLVPATASAAPAAKQAADISKIVQDAISEIGLKAVLVEVKKGDNVIIRKAFGESMTGVPAATDMHFRNGAVAFSYLGQLMMQFVDEHKLKLDDTVDKWFPDYPNADKVTVKMLANQTSGYTDYQTSPDFAKLYSGDPFQIIDDQKKIELGFSRPPLFAPGANWSYAHTNFVVLGQILAKVGKKPLDVLLREKVLEPFGLHGTTATATADIPTPLLHTYSLERTGLYEEATFWNTAWGTPDGANETTTLDDLITTAQAIGTGKGLSKASAKEMLAPELIGFGQTDETCKPSCFAQSPFYNFTLGTIRQGDWLLQTPLLSGIGATEAYLPQEKISIAVVITLKPEAFEAGGNYPPNPSKTLFTQIGTYLSPDHAPPVQKKS